MFIFSLSDGFYEGNKRGVLATSWLDFDNFTLVGTFFGSVRWKITKSEVIRAGLHILESLSDEELVEVINRLEKVKTGRPTEKV